MKRKAEWCEGRSHALATALVKTVKLSAVMAVHMQPNSFQKSLKEQLQLKKYRTSS